MQAVNGLYPLSQQVICLQICVRVTIAAVDCRESVQAFNSLQKRVFRRQVAMLRFDANARLCRSICSLVHARYSGMGSSVFPTEIK